MALQPKSSRRRSSTNRPPDPYVVFLDRDLGTKKFARILARTGAEIRCHQDLFAPTTDDATWLRAVGQRGWLAMTRDRGILKVPIETDTVMRTGVALFILVGQLTHQQLAENVVATWGKVMAFRNRYTPPFIALVHRPDKGELGLDRGRVEMALTERRWRELREPR